jgi:hypothetical protein
VFQQFGTRPRHAPTASSSSSANEEDSEATDQAAAPRQPTKREKERLNQSAQLLQRLTTEELKGSKLTRSVSKPTAPVSWGQSPSNPWASQPGAGPSWIPQPAFFGTGPPKTGEQTKKTTAPEPTEEEHPQPSRNQEAQITEFRTRARTISQVVTVQKKILMVAFIFLSFSILPVYSQANPGHTILFDEVGQMAVGMSVIHVAIPINLTSLHEQADHFHTHLKLLTKQTVADPKKMVFVKQIVDIALFAQKQLDRIASQVFLLDTI